MKDDKKYQEEFSNYVEIISEALKKNDFKAYNMAREMLDESISEYQHKEKLMEQLNTNNFGILNHIFESELPTLIRTNKKGVKNVIKTIKEDKNLLGEFNFYNVLKNQYTENVSNIVSADALISKLMENIDIDKKTLKASNDKLRKVMAENNIIPSEFIDEDTKKLYENGDVVLSKRRTPSNVVKLAESCQAIAEYMDSHKKSITEEKNLEKIIGDFEDKLRENLNESEISLVQQITDFRTPIAEQRKKKLFDAYKNECVKRIDGMLREDSDNMELKNLKEEISSMEFNNETIVKDIAKLLEIRDILIDD
jgi:hypothetical protein